VRRAGAAQRARRALREQWWSLPTSVLYHRRRGAWRGGLFGPVRAPPTFRAAGSAGGGEGGGRAGRAAGAAPSRGGARRGRTAGGGRGAKAWGAPRRAPARAGGPRRASRGRAGVRGARAGAAARAREDGLYRQGGAHGGRPALASGLRGVGCSPGGALAPGRGGSAGRMQSCAGAVQRGGAGTRARPRSAAPRPPRLGVRGLAAARGVGGGGGRRTRRPLWIVGRLWGRLPSSAWPGGFH
jgi:hypothetical protein